VSDAPGGTPPNRRLARIARIAALPAAHAGRSAVGLGLRLGGRPAEAVHRLATQAGVLRPGKVAPDALLALLDPYLDPLRAPAYTFGRAWIQEQSRRASDPRSAESRTQRRLSVPPRHLLVQRVAAGLAGVLCSLGATVAVDDDVRRFLPGYA